MAPRLYTSAKFTSIDGKRLTGKRQVMTVDDATLALDPEFTKSGAPTANPVSRPSGSRPRPNDNDQAQTGLATAAIAAGFAVGALVVIVGACYLVYFIRKNRRRKHPKWNMVGPTITTSDISAPMPLESAGPYSHLSDAAFAPRAPPLRKPAPKFVVDNDEGDEDDNTSADSHAGSVRIVKTVVQEVHRSIRPTPPRPQRPPTLIATPTVQYFDQPPLAVTNTDRASIALSPTATLVAKRQTLRSAPAAASEYAEAIMDEPSPFIQTAPMIPVANPFVDPMPPIAYPIVSGQAAQNRFSSNNPFNRFSVAGTLTAVSTARSGFFPADLPFENRSPPSLPVSALGSTETPPTQHPGLPTLDQFPMPPASRAESLPSMMSGSSARSRASRPVVPLRISTFPYALPRVEAITAPSTASTVVEPSPGYNAAPNSNNMQALPPALPRLVIEPPTGVAQRTSDLLEAMGLEQHAPAFRSAGMELLSSLRFSSSDGLQRVDPALSTDDAEGLVVAVDDALRSASKGRTPRVPFRPMST